MKFELDKLMEMGSRVVETAARTTGKVVDKGRDKVEIYSLQTKLSKAQKQLGALVYMLHKTGQENQPMMEHYISEIDRIKMQLQLLDAPAEESIHTAECPTCGAEVSEDAMFCRRCGAELSREESDDSL